MAMMKTAGVKMRRTTRTRCSTWTSSFSRRARATCCLLCASWPNSTPSSPSSAWSATTVWRYRWQLTWTSVRLCGDVRCNLGLLRTLRFLWWSLKGRRKSPGSWSLTAFTSPSSRQMTTSRANGIDWSSIHRESSDRVDLRVQQRLKVLLETVSVEAKWLRENFWIQPFSFFLIDFIFFFFKQIVANTFFLLQVLPQQLLGQVY